MRKHLGIEIFPNPADSQITIKTGNNVLLSDVEIFSIQGRSVLRKTHINSNKATLKLTDLHAGIYIVRTTSDQGATWNKKLRIE
jgi:hypothetical protein